MQKFESLHFGCAGDKLDELKSAVGERRARKIVRMMVKMAMEDEDEERTSSRHKVLASPACVF